MPINKQYRNIEIGDRMSWRKYFKVARNQAGVDSPLTHRHAGRNTGEDAMGVNTYPNLIPESYTGCTNRIERYSNFESMDSDSEINSALDILAEFSTQNDEHTGMCFTIKYKEPPTETESKLIKKQLQSWYALNQFNKRAFRIFRNVLKYGDQVFIRDPETFKIFYCEMDNVIKVIVNESDGKKPEQYIIRNINPNFQNLTVTQVSSNNLYNVIPNGPGYTAAGSGYNLPNSPNSSSSRFSQSQNEHCIDAEHILHLSLTEGLDPNWPFGNSILDLVFRVYKQKELLEDSILIYRITRAPERRVFKIDVGDMPSHLAMQFIEKVKNEIHQRRIPGRTEGAQNFMDSTYQGLPPNADFFFPQTAAGRGTDVTTLPGAQNLNEINDLLYFNNKMMRGLRIPSSYLPTGADDSSTTYNDGRMGTALIQEYRFNQYCQRLQKLICGPLDTEFKAYLKWCGINIDSSIFTLEFNPPQNFASYRQAELDATKISTFTQLEAYPYMAKRFLLKRYLGLTEDEIIENQKLWKEEHVDINDQESAPSDLRNIGITPGGIDSEMETFGEPEMGGGMPEGEGGVPEAGAEGEGAPPVTGTPTPGPTPTE
jgi:hypothetical protein